MGFIPKARCRRCGREFSGLRSACPHCNAQRKRVRDGAPSPMQGQGGRARNEANARWQMIFSGIIVLAAITAVIVLVSGNLNSTLSGEAEPTAPLPVVSMTPVPTPTPTPTPTPPLVTGVQIQSFGAEITEFSMDTGTTEALAAIAFPYDIVPQFVWSSADESIATVDQTGVVTGVSAGTTTVTVDCYGVTASVIVRVR